METKMRNLLKHFGIGRKTSNVFFSYQGVSDPQWTPCRYDTISENAFQKNAIAFRAINLISRGIASIPMSVKNHHDKSENLELTNLLNRPNENQSRGMFFESLVNYLLISGNAFIYWGENGDLNCLRTDRIRVVPNASKTAVESYQYDVDTSTFILSRNDILHLKLFNPLNDWYGLGPLQVASRSIDQHNAISDHNLAVLQNGGRPSGCLMVKNGTENLSDEQREQLREDIKNAYAGSSNAGKMMVLEGCFEWKEMGFSPKDLDFSGGKNISSREIALALGVPPSMVELCENSNFGSYKESRLHLWEDTILPIGELVRLELSNWFSKKIGTPVEIVFNLDAIHALTSKREILWQKISDANFLTTNEKREILGFPPLNESDVKKNK